ncbi:MAG: glucose-1-phosphate adenylyltransferase [Candidatus Omnitrophica bacterium]|nr:glucose-1-phosphate adenylyltransferase [Candidatus Omnitrophota bacterium]MBD3269796.1 glucose-1-phosphate adenylyltransferase [Candidatus Omnitrophota bacterium]
MREVLCLVLGGGRGVRLNPLTKYRSKPAVPFAAKYRLVDIPISNSLNSGFNHIYVLTQFNSESLNKHITRTYKLDPFSGGFVEIMAAEQSMDSMDWFQGTADAVRRCLKHFNNPSVEYVLVLSGDQFYRMDFKELLAFHNENKADITIACKPIAGSEIKDFGIMGTDKRGRINNFIEKPQDEDAVESMGILIEGKRYYLASMGIYLFNKEVLTEILYNNNKADFGKEVMPDSFPHKLTYSYIHKGEWKDIGTIKAFYEENLIFTDSASSVNLFDESWPFFTHPRYLPPASVEEADLKRTLLGDGSILRRCSINHSVIGLRSCIYENSRIEDSILMGADYYESKEDKQRDVQKEIPFVGVGRNCLIKKAIIDKNARIGDNVRIVNEKGVESFESERYYIKEGIVIIPKGCIIDSGTVI